MSTKPISHHFSRLFQPQKISPPRQFETLDNSFWQSDRPLMLEIGAGKGLHACSYALTHPQQKIIAIERTRNKFAAFKKRIDQHRDDGKSLNNLLAVHADAIAFVVHASQPASIDTVYLLYPNPESNNPNQQWLNMPFFEYLLSRLKPQGTIILASNIEQYMTHAGKQATDVWQLPAVRRMVEPNSTRTHFEIKYLAKGEPCMELILTKPAGYRTRFDTHRARSLTSP